MENIENVETADATIEDMTKLLDALDGYGIIYTDECLVSERLEELGFKHQPPNNLPSKEIDVTDLLGANFTKTFPEFFERRSEIEQ